MNKLGIVVPCYNEEEVLHETARQLNQLIDKLTNSGRISPDSFVLFVNDGSHDQTWKIIQELNRTNQRFGGISLARNSGHQHALLAGLIVANGMADMLVSIDADLQDDINAIEDMVDRYHEGYDIVYGVRKSRETDTFFKRNTALLFYRLMRSMGVDIVFNHADFRLMSQRAVEQLTHYKERNLFLRGIVPLIGYRTTTVYYDRKARFAGESKYPLRKMLSFAVNGITSFSVKPIRMILWLGVVLLFISILAFIYILSATLHGNTVPGWSSIMFSIWFFGSLILICIGIVGEYIGKIYLEVKERPRYNISERIMPHPKQQ